MNVRGLVEICPIERIRVVDRDTGEVLDIGKGRKFPCYIEMRTIKEIIPYCDASFTAYIMVKTY